MSIESDIRYRCMSVPMSWRGRASCWWVGVDSAFRELLDAIFTKPAKARFVMKQVRPGEPGYEEAELGTCVTEVGHWNWANKKDEASA